MIQTNDFCAPIPWPPPCHPATGAWNNHRKGGMKNKHNTSKLPIPSTRIYRSVKKDAGVLYIVYNTIRKCRNNLSFSVQQSFYIFFEMCIFISLKHFQKCFLFRKPHNDSAGNNSRCFIRDNRFQKRILQVVWAN